MYQCGNLVILKGITWNKSLRIKCWYWLFSTKTFVIRPVAFDLLEKIKSCQMDIIDNVALDSPKIYFIVSVNCIFHILKCIYQIFQDVKHMSFMLLIRIIFHVQGVFFHAHPCHIFVYISPVYSSALQCYSLRLKGWSFWKERVAFVWIWN